LTVYSVENKRTLFTDYSYMTEFTEKPQESKNAIQ